MNTKTKKQRNVSAPTSDTAAAVKWLYNLDEATFRDDVLEHLFQKMFKAGDRTQLFEPPGGLVWEFVMG